MCLTANKVIIIMCVWLSKYVNDTIESKISDLYQIVFNLMKSNHFKWQIFILAKINQVRGKLKIYEEIFAK